MEIRGQFQIIRLSEQDTLKLNLWLKMRHCQYNMDTVTRNMADILDMEDNTLFGEYGEHGEFLIPSVRQHEKLEKLEIEVEHSDELRYFQRRLEKAMLVDSNDWEAYSTPCGPHLYYDFQVVSPGGEEYSYLFWAGGEKTSFSKETFEYLDKILVQMGSGFLEGRMSKMDYGEVSTVSIYSDGIGPDPIVFEEKKQEDIRVEEDYILYWDGCEPPKTAYAVYYRSDAVRNQEVFIGTEEMLKDGTAVYDDQNWEAMDKPLYLGIVYAYDCYGARLQIAKKLGKSKDLILVEAVYQV